MEIERNCKLCNKKIGLSNKLEKSKRKLFLKKQQISISEFIQFLKLIRAFDTQTLNLNDMREKIELDHGDKKKTVAKAYQEANFLLVNL